MFHTHEAGGRRAVGLLRRAVTRTWPPVDTAVYGCGVVDDPLCPPSIAAKQADVVGLPVTKGDLTLHDPAAVGRKREAEHEIGTPQAPNYPAASVHEQRLSAAAFAYVPADRDRKQSPVGRPVVPVDLLLRPVHHAAVRAVQSHGHDLFGLRGLREARERQEGLARGERGLHAVADDAAAARAVRP